MTSQIHGHVEPPMCPCVESIFTAVMKDRGEVTPDQGGPKSSERVFTRDR